LLILIGIPSPRHIHGKIPTPIHPSSISTRLVFPHRNRDTEARPGDKASRRVWPGLHKSHPSNHTLFPSACVVFSDVIQKHLFMPTLLS